MPWHGPRGHKLNRDHPSWCRCQDADYRWWRAEHGSRGGNSQRARFAEYNASKPKPARLARAAKNYRGPYPVDRILDLYCGAGLVADGLKAAGFDPTGVDIAAQPRYPGPFLKHDALTLDERLLDSFSFIWASPPCLDATELKASARREQAAHGSALTEHRDLIPPTRAMLQRWAARTGGKWVIENVRKAKLVNPVVLNGFMFGLGVAVDGVRYHLQRERKFETNWALDVPPFERKSPVIGVYGGHARCRSAKAGGRVSGDFPGVEDKTALMRAAMGVTRHLTGAEVSQGVPPIYAEWVGRRLLAHLRESEAA